MSITMKLPVIMAFFLSFAAPFGAFAAGEKTRGRYKLALGANVLLFFGTLILASLLLFSGRAFASPDAAGLQDAAAKTAAVSASTASVSTGMAYLAAALSTGLSGLGGGIAVSAAASSALGAISEDSSVFGKSLIFAGLAEGVCLYGLIISFMILGSL